MKFRNEKVDEVIIIENCDARTLEYRLSDLPGTIIDVQYSAVKKLTKTLHNALVLIRYKNYE